MRRAGRGLDVLAEAPAQFLDLVEDQFLKFVTQRIGRGRNAIDNPISTTVRMASTAAIRSTAFPSATSSNNAAIGASPTPAQKSMVSSGLRRDFSMASGEGMEMEPTHSS